MEIIKTYIVMYSSGMEKLRPVKRHKTENNKYYLDEGKSLLEVSEEHSEVLRKHKI